MKFLTSLRTLLLALALSIGISYAYAAWTSPTASPTGGNIEAPVNIGGGTQVKAGALTVNGLLTAVSKLMVGGSGTPPGGLTLGVAGNVGADKYCDRNGANCISGSASGITFPDGSTQTTAVSGGAGTISYPYLCRYQAGFAYASIYVGRYSSLPGGCTLAGNNTWTYYGQSSDRGGEPGACYCWKVTD